MTLGIAAALLVVASIPVWRVTRQPTAIVPAPADAGLPRPPIAAREVSTAFLPLIYSNVPITNGEIVRLEVPRAALASFGLAPMEAVDAPLSSTVLADVLVGEDGLARAVRFVRPAATSARGSTGSP